MFKNRGDVMSPLEHDDEVSKAYQELTELSNQHPWKEPSMQELADYFASKVEEHEVRKWWQRKRREQR